MLEDSKAYIDEVGRVQIDSYTTYDLFAAVEFQAMASEDEGFWTPTSLHMPSILAQYIPTSTHRIAIGVICNIN